VELGHQHETPTLPHFNILSVGLDLRGLQMEKLNASSPIFYTLLFIQEAMQFFHNQSEQPII
jgi:hypothetical protein